MRCGIAPFDPRQGGLDDLNRLQRVGPLGRHAVFQIPKFPRRAHHQRFGCQGRDVVILGKISVDGPHGIGIVIVPLMEDIQVVALFRLKAAGHRLAQRLLDGRYFGVRREDDRLLRILVARRDRHRPAGRRHFIPRDVVIRPGSIGDAPVAHGTIWIEFDHLLEASYRFLVMKGIAPVQAAIVPSLRLIRFGRNRPRIGGLGENTNP